MMVQEGRQGRQPSVQTERVAPDRKSVGSRDVFVRKGISSGFISFEVDSDRGTSLESLSQNESPHQKMGSDRTNAGTESHSAETYQQKEGDRPPSRKRTSTRRLFDLMRTELAADPEDLHLCHQEHS